MKIRSRYSSVFHKITELAIPACIVFSLNTQVAQAMPIYQTSGDTLTGIQNIEINGSHYDVEFIDGEIQSLYDLGDPFFFSTGSAAADATFALQNVLMDVVYGAFDSDPLLTFGCAGDNCYLHVPYLYDFGYVSTEWFRNAAEPLDDERGSADLLPTYDSTGNSTVFTRWSVSEVIEPSSLWMMIFGVGGLFWFKRSKSRSTN